MQIERICERLNYKEDEVYDLNYISCLNWLSFWKEKEEYIEALEKEARK